MTNPKICTGCGYALPRSAFHRDKRAASGLRSRCIDCRKEARSADVTTQAKQQQYAIRRAIKTLAALDNDAWVMSAILETRATLQKEKLPCAPVN